MSDDTLQQISGQTQFEEATARLRKARSPLHIMVVDDDPVTQRLVKGLLGARYRVTLCSTVQQAVAEYPGVMPDLVFLDIDLGDKQFSGLDVAYTLAMQDKNANIVMLTSNDKPETIAIAGRAGAYGFLAKPFGVSRLMHYVEECEAGKVRVSSKESYQWN